MDILLLIRMVLLLVGYISKPYTTYIIARLIATLLGNDTPCSWLN